MHKVKVETGCQLALVHLQRPRAWRGEGPCRARGMPLNLPFPRSTAQSIWFRGKFKTV